MTIMLTLNPVRSVMLLDHLRTDPITVINVMKRDLVVIYADGMDVPHLEEILQSTDYRGFPVVKSQADATVLGFIRKTELRFSLGESDSRIFVPSSDIAALDYRQNTETSRGRELPDLYVSKLGR
jgi:hypothetical protein